MSGKDAYETFDSASGPTIPSKSKEDFAHNDANPSDQGVEQGAVPTMPQKK